MFRLKISWGLAFCLTLLVAEAGNAAPRVGGFPAPRGEASLLDLEALWARAWSWLVDTDVTPKHGLIIDPDGGPSATPRDGSGHGSVTDSNSSQ